MVMKPLVNATLLVCCISPNCDVDGRVRTTIHHQAMPSKCMLHKPTNMPTKPFLTHPNILDEVDAFK